MTALSRDSKPTRQRIEQFAAWFEARLIARGYDLSLRGGGRAKFAATAGISASTVSRILKRQSIPDPKVLALIAPHVGATLGEILVEAGVATDEQIKRVGEATPGGGRITPEQAADLLGITSPLARQLFVPFAEQLQRQEDERRQAEEEGRRRSQ